MSAQKRPVVSFVVPTYNYGHFIGDCLDSILNQTANVEVEIIVIDDASSDNTSEVVRSFAEPRIRYIRHDTNMGHVQSISEGLTNARGSYVARIDSDDRYRPHFLTAALNVFRKYPEVGLVYGDVASINQNGDILSDPWDGIRSREVHRGEDYTGDEYLALIEENFVPTPSVIVRRSALKEALPIPDDFYYLEDWYLNLKVARKYDLHYVARTLAEYRIHSGNHHSTMLGTRAAETTLLRVLDGVFADDHCADKKRKIRRKVYATAYLNLGNKYFGLGMDTDARRCYLKAASYRPPNALNGELLRRLIGTYIGRSAYETCKGVYHLVRSIDGP